MRRARTRHKRQRGNDRRLTVLGSPLQRARRAQSRARAGARAPAVALHGSRTRVPRGVTVPTAPNDTSSERQSHDRPTIEDGRKLRPNTQEKHASASASASARDTRAGKPCTARRTAKDDDGWSVQVVVALRSEPVENRIPTSDKTPHGA